MKLSTKNGASLLALILVAMTPGLGCYDALAATVANARPGNQFHGSVPPAIGSITRMDLSKMPLSGSAYRPPLAQALPQISGGATAAAGLPVIRGTAGVEASIKEPWKNRIATLSGQVAAIASLRNISDQLAGLGRIFDSNRQQPALATAGYGRHQDFGSRAALHRSAPPKGVMLLTGIASAASALPAAANNLAANPDANGVVGWSWSFFASIPAVAASSPLAAIVATSVGALMALAVYLNTRPATHSWNGTPLNNVRKKLLSAGVALLAGLAVGSIIFFTLAHAYILTGTIIASLSTLIALSGIFSELG